MPMPALAIVSTDLMAPAPQSAASPNTGNEGSFASHLKNASDQQTAASTPTGAAQKHARGHHAHDAAQSQGAKKSNSTLLKGVSEDTPAAPTSPSGEVDTMAQQPEPAMQADTAPPEHMLVNPLAIGQPHREAAMAKLLASLTTGVTAGTGKELRANISSQASQPTVQQPVPQMTAQQANQQPAPQPASVQLPGELSGSVAMPATPAVEAPATTAAPVSHSVNPGAQAITVATVAGGSAADQTAQAAKQPQITITVAATTPQATESADAAPPEPSAPAATTEATASALNAQAQPGASMVVQNRYGQIITIHQGNTGDEEGDIPASTAPKSEKQPIDVNGNYIRSRLLKNHSDSAMKPEKNFQTDNTSQAARQQAQTSTAEAVKPASAGEQLAAQKAQPAMNQEPAPLVAAGQPQGTGQQASVSTPIASTTMHLPSGMTVPDGTVVDQMITHFSVNKQLETSTVNLRLYPEELGELRMEIKVSQDNIKAHIVVQNPQAQEMIDRHLPRLREALEQQGLQLQQVEVSVAAHGQTGGERFQENNAWSQQAPSSGSHLTSQSDFTQELEEIAGDDTATSTLSVLV